ncbi:hypothetical protein [Candidatus Poriferisodalis sp.]|uniref:hypothetical protein n=1 Tax=Candidatus Poriferisodalis sp. TaxID=3101277 RepID=UPI003B02BC4D
MNQKRWINRSQPQTLFSAVLLSYFSAGLLLLGNRIDVQLGRDVFERIVSLFADERTAFDLSGRLVVPAVTVLLCGAYIAGGAGTARERRWGHWLCSAAAIYAAVATLWWGARTSYELGVLMRLMFDALLLVLLYHPMSRDYRRVWFR